MRIGKLVKTVIKLAPVIYPVVRKLMKDKKAASTTIPRK